MSLRRWQLLVILITALLLVASVFLPAIPVSASPGVTYVSSREDTYTTTGAKTIVVSPALNDVIILSLISNGNMGATVSDDKSNTWTLVGQGIVAIFLRESFIAMNVASGTTTITLTIPGGGDKFQVVTSLYRGVASRFVPGTLACHYSEGQANTITITTGTNNPVCPLWSNNAVIVAYSGTSEGCGITTATGTNRFSSSTFMGFCQLLQDNTRTVPDGGTVVNSVSNPGLDWVFIHSFGFTPTDSLALTGSFTNAGSSVSMLSVTVTVNTGQKVFLFVHFDDPTKTVSTVSDNGGNAWTFQVRKDAPGGLVRMEAWNATATAGMTSITVTLSGAVNLGLMVFPFRNLVSIRSNVTASGTTATTSISASTVGTNDWVFGAIQEQTTMGSATNIQGNLYQNTLNHATVAISFAGLGNASATAQSRTLGFTYSATSNWTAVMFVAQAQSDPTPPVQFDISAALAIWPLLVFISLTAVFLWGTYRVRKWRESR